jgi:hypothetical protein
MKGKPVENVVKLQAIERQGDGEAVPCFLA